MKTIKLTKGMTAIVDDDLYEELSKYKWCFGNGYATRRLPRREGGRIAYMHRIVMNTPDHMMCDHISRDTMDNRRCNLRNCTASANRVNHKLYASNKSGHTGVFWSNYDRRWIVRISFKDKGRKPFYGGRYTDISDAAKAAEKLRHEVHGEFACAG